MANHRIRASSTTRIFGVGIKTVYMPAPRPTHLSTNQASTKVTAADLVHASTGLPLRIGWQMTPMAESFEVQLFKVRPSDLGLALAQVAIITAPFFNWTPTMAGLYVAWVRARINGEFTGWVKSDEPVIDGNGANRGWLIHAYLAPVSGGGIN